MSFPSKTKRKNPARAKIKNVKAIFLLGGVYPAYSFAVVRDATRERRDSLAGKNFLPLSSSIFARSPAFILIYSCYNQQVAKSKIIVRSNPRDIFLHLLNFGSLYMGAVSLGALWFQYIDYLWPDSLTFYHGGTFDQIRWASAALIVVFPVFLLTAWRLEKDFSIEPQKREARFRKWLVYFTLFVAAVTVMVDLVALVFNFYSGELTKQFVFKISAVFLVAGGTGSYYFQGLKLRSRSWSKKWGGAALLVVIATIVSGFFVVGSPARQRQVRFDEERAGDLQTIQNQIVNFWTVKESLPASLTELSDQLSGFIPPRDPQTGEEYGYRTLGDLSFELCANFKTTGNSKTTRFRMGDARPYPLSEASLETTSNFREFWDYQPGNNCFERSIDPERLNLRREKIPL